MQAEVIVSTPEEFGPCCEELAKHAVIGMDTEFVGEESYHPNLCLIQVATPTTLYLIDPLSVGPLDPFWKLIVDPGRVVVVHAGREEVRMCRLGAGSPPGCLFDVQIAAGLVGRAYPLSHGALVHQLLGLTLNKGETLTEWRQRPLTTAQIRYAFDDVRYLLQLYQRISNRLTTLGRVDWAREEFARIQGSTDPEEVATERWRKLRGLGSLDRRRLASARALFQWRESVAARQNRPVRTVLRDDLIIEIARRNPDRERDLEVMRGVPRREQEAILQTVRAARQLPLEQCPELTDREQDPPQVGLVAGILGAVLVDRCGRLELASNLVASGNDLKQLVRARLTGSELPTTVPLTRGWRQQVLLPELLAILDGQRLVRIADVASETPLGYA